MRREQEKDDCNWESEVKYRLRDTYLAAGTHSAFHSCCTNCQLEIIHDNFDPDASSFMA